MLAADRPWDFDATADNRSAQVIQVEALGRGGIVVLLATVIVALLVAAMSYGLAGRAMDRASMAERESRILKDEVDRLKVELKINTNH